MKSFIGMLILFVGFLISSLIYDKMQVLSIVIFVVTIVLCLIPASIIIANSTFKRLAE